MQLKGFISASAAEMVSGVEFWVDITGDDNNVIDDIAKGFKAEVSKAEGVTKADLVLLQHDIDHSIHVKLITYFFVYYHKLSEISIKI
ncbi:MAG: hypothetical protein ACLFWZ_06550 [Coleofasciculus sp.]